MSVIVVDFFQGPSLWRQLTSPTSHFVCGSSIGSIVLLGGSVTSLFVSSGALGIRVPFDIRVLFQRVTQNFDRIISNTLCKHFQGGTKQKC